MNISNKILSRNLKLYIQYIHKYIHLKKKKTKPKCMLRIEHNNNNNNNNNTLLTYFRQVAIYKLKVQILKYPRFKTLKK